MTDYVFIVKDHIGHYISAWPSRHDASFAKSQYHDCNDYEIVTMHAFAFWLDQPRVKLPRERHGWWSG